MKRLISGDAVQWWILRQEAITASTGVTGFVSECACALDELMHLTPSMCKQLLPTNIVRIGANLQEFSLTHYLPSHRKKNAK